MIKVHPKTIKLAIEALQERIWFQENSSFPDTNYIQRARMAISNLEEYEWGQQWEKEEKFSIRTNE